ncbi:MAG: DUF1566 domain-containing protein [Bacteroidales bacterium]|jgi:hypothetical protein|nr:DUF1566 domain-containing protein [Bacteroidales bacterium]
MKRSFLKVSLLIALGFASTVFTSCEDKNNNLLPLYTENPADPDAPDNPDNPTVNEEEEFLPMDWVEINGVKWATRNILATKPEEYNRNSYHYWKEAQWACSPHNREGEKWRLPTVEEFRKLLDSGNTLTTINGVVGRQFGSGDNTIFLPATGYGGDFYIPGVNTGYWSSQKYFMRIESFGEEYIKEFASFLHFSKEVQDNILIDDIETRDIRLAVRCVCELE